MIISLLIIILNNDLVIAMVTPFTVERIFHELCVAADKHTNTIHFFKLLQLEYERDETSRRERRSEEA